ncbi:unnamed protein product [Porites evermanni]|uniref:Gag protein n=1 Tax=Porites evermanni TaxID=104178 RepID=A0ABN8PYP0_9CNID|nr:unnamed protein product [Porites evermanni]
MPFYQIPPPAPMNVKDGVSTNWKLFKEAWCYYYVTATELNKKSKEGQAGALCSVMGMDCVKVMNSLTTLTASDKRDPEKILSALSDHFMPQKHLLFERVKFSFANQAENESIDQYVVRLRQLVGSCEFENLWLARCIKALRASELSRIHKEQYKDTVDSPYAVHAAEKHHLATQKRKGNSGSSKGNLKGRDKTGKEKPSERVGVVSSNETRSSFMLDTGAPCSAMSYTDLLNVLQLGEVQLDPPGGTIRLYDGSVVNPFGSFQSAETEFERQRHQGAPVRDIFKSPFLASTIKEQSNLEAKLGALKEMISEGWLIHIQLHPTLLKPNWPFRHQIASENGIFTKAYHTGLPLLRLCRNTFSPNPTDHTK